MSDAFWQGLWQGVFQLVALGVVGFWVNFVYQRFRTRMAARQELVDEIDQFTIRLYKPRKMYQRALDLGAGSPGRDDLVLRSIEEVLDATGRFRSLQVKIVPLFGYHVDLFGYYLAIWRYLKEVRDHMDGGKSLYLHHESPDSADAFYRLMDAFRYRIQIEPTSDQPPGLVQPPPELLQKMKDRGREIHEQFFGRDAAAG